MRRSPTGAGAAAPATGPRLGRLVLAITCAVAVLALAPRAATPGSGAWFGIVAGPPVVAAASPEPSAPGTDTRSVGEGPGLVGAPFLAIVGVAALGIAAAGATLLYLRLTAGPAGRGNATGEGRDQGRTNRRD